MVAGIDGANAAGRAGDRATADEAAYDDWDSNEIAAAMLQAELCGDATTAEKLKAILANKRGIPVIDLEAEGPLSEEHMEVPVSAVGAVIGYGGQTVRRLSEESG